MNSFLIKHNNNILGIYNNLDFALDFIYGLLNGNLIQKTSNIIIYEYKINTCIILQEYSIDLDHLIIEKSTINYNKLKKLVNIELNNIKYETESSYISSESNINTEEEENCKKKEKEFINKQNILGQDKINVVHNINLLKEELKKNEEKLIQYNYDLELYYKFKDYKNTNKEFVIPYMFEKKYNIFNVLDNENKLSYENFTKKYKPEKINTQFDQFFEDIQNSEISEISEVFYNANESELYLATNQ